MQLPVHDDTISPVPDPYLPASHGPLHAELVSPVVDPYVPAGQAIHDGAAPVLYCPAAHTTAVALVEPAGHAYPAAHDPVQAALVRPVVEP